MGAHGRIAGWMMGPLAALLLGAVAGLAPLTAAAQQGGPAVRVRTGEHFQYSRIVFDWSRRIEYTVRQSGNRAIISFASPGTINFGGFNRRPPRWIEQAVAEPADGGTRVTLRLAPTAKVRHLRSGNKVVLDVLEPDGKPVPESQEPASAEKPGQPKQSKATTQTAKAEPGKPKIDNPQAGKPKPPGPAVPPAARDSNPAPAPAAQPVDGVSKAPLPAPKGTPAEAAPDDASGPTPTGAIALRFDMDEAVGAALFARAGFTWVVFDKSTALDMAALRRASGGMITSVVQFPSQQATILRMTTAPGINPALGRQGFAWILDLRRRALGARAPLEPKAQPSSPVGARLFVTVPQPGRAIVVPDPEVGDNMVVVPLIPLGLGVMREYSYPQVRFPPTAHGLVILPVADGITVQSLRQGVAVTSKTPLRISEVSAAAGADGKLANMRPLTKILDMEQWSRATLGSFTATHQRLIAEAGQAKGEAKEKARIDLARYYLASGFGSDALGVLGTAADARPAIKEQPLFRALGGAANYLMGRYVEAETELAHASLAGNDEAAFWRAAARARAGDLFGAARVLRRTGAVVRPYPKALKVPLSILVAEAVVEMGDFKQAQNYLEQLAAAEPGPDQAARIAYVEGRLMELAGKFDDAVGKWEIALKGTDRLARARSGVARAELLMKQQKIPRAEGVEEMEKQRFSWRGDEFEFRLLRRLGTLHLEEGDFREGLSTLRQAATYFRNHPQAPAVTQQMADAFDRLYMKGDADRVAPVTAIALYDEFKELTPAGAKGDEMIRKLADRLVGVDLLDRAAQLLEGQIKFRLKGELRTKVATRLAVVRLMAREPEKAIETLDKSNLAGLPNALQAQRRHLKARALADMGKPEAALELLASDESLDANRLRLDLYWEARNWRDASKMMQQILKSLGTRPRNPIDETQARYLLNLGIAYALAGNARALGRLRSEYGQAMEKTPLKAAFNLIASPQPQDFVSRESIAGRVQLAENFKAFMAVYRERLKKGNLSAIN